MSPSAMGPVLSVGGWLPSDESSLPPVGGMLLSVGGSMLFVGGFSWLGWPFWRWPGRF